MPSKDTVKRNILFSAVLILAAAGTVILIARSGGEPSANGHRLTFWLEQYTFNKNAEGRQAARDAIRSLGTNSLPVLLTMLAARDSPIKSRLLELAERQSFFHLTSARQYHLMARNGFQILGRIAQPAVPALNKLANDPDDDIRKNAVYSYYDTMGGADINAQPINAQPR